MGLVVISACSSVPEKRQIECSQVCMTENGRKVSSEKNYCVCKMEDQEKLEKVSIPMLKIRE